MAESVEIFKLRLIFNLAAQVESDSKNQNLSIKPPRSAKSADETEKRLEKIRSASRANRSRKLVRFARHESDPEGQADGISRGRSQR